ncbi:hypothetical protein BY996DRAFT_6590187 [Phakopsora pachyrhizi]|nr:hypothetical protein BY996DRAFT_6590187 [Phakopsora pachyrhizi]
MIRKKKNLDQVKEEEIDELEEHEERIIFNLYDTSEEGSLSDPQYLQEDKDDDEEITSNQRRLKRINNKLNRQRRNHHRKSYERIRKIKEFNWLVYGSDEAIRVADFDWTRKKKRAKGMSRRSEAEEGLLIKNNPIITYNLSLPSNLDNLSVARKKLQEFGQGGHSSRTLYFHKKLEKRQFQIGVGESASFAAILSKGIVGVFRSTYKSMCVWMTESESEVKRWNKENGRIKDQMEQWMDELAEVVVPGAPDRTSKHDKTTRKILNKTGHETGHEETGKTHMTGQVWMYGQQGARTEEQRIKDRRAEDKGFRRIKD